MACKNNGNRIIGPYFDRRREHWYFTEIIDGARTWVPIPGCENENEAREHVEGARDRLAAPTVDTLNDAVGAFVKHIASDGGNASSVSFAKAALAPLVKAHGDATLKRFCGAWLDEYLTNTADRSMASRRSYWKAVVRFATWIRKRGMITRDVVAEALRERERQDKMLPWRTRDGAREVGRGKVQLRNQSEVVAYLETALALGPHQRAAKADRQRVADERRVASCLPLLCGLASGEVLHLKVGDVDLASSVGYVRDAGAAEVDGWHVKRDSRTGEWEVPEVLRESLGRLTADRAFDAYLLHDGSGRPHQRAWLLDLVTEACQASKVDGQPIRTVPPHGLRGTCATLQRVLAKRSIGDIAAMLRHGDNGRVAANCYVGASERRQALKVIVGGKKIGARTGQNSVQGGLKAVVDR